MTTLNVEGTLLTASADDRILTYRLLPYGEQGRTSAGRVTASRGVVQLPADPATLVANMEHDRTRPVARFTSIDEDDDGLRATLRVLPTTQGNDLLVEAAEGVRTGISVELDGFAIRNGQLVAGTLTGAGFCATPAFPSAQLVASDAGELPDEHDDDPEPVEDEPETTTPEDDPEDDDDKENDVNDTLTAAAPAGLGSTNRSAIAERPLSEVMRFLANEYRDGGDERLLAALTDIKANTGVGANVIPAGWISELWAGRTYQRRYVPLVTGAALQGMTLKGWKWTTKPAVATYAGDKAAVTSNAPATAPVSVAVQRLAGAHDVDRAYRDFEVTEFWESYYRAMTDSYAALSDAACLTDLLAAATAPAAPASGLSTWTPAASIVDGALAVIAANGTPTAAIVGTDLYKSLLLTPQQNMVELLSGGLGWSESQASGFTIVPSASAALTGKALVLDKAGFVFAELPGSPIRVEAINQANAGIDPGVFGYFADYAIDPTLLQLISKPTA